MNALLAATSTGLSPFVLICALWGYGASWANEIIKQDHWPKWANTLIADAILVVSAALATLTDATFTWPNLESAVIAVAAAALLNHQFFLKPTGIGDLVQTATTIKKDAQGSPDPPATSLAAIIKANTITTGTILADVGLADQPTAAPTVASTSPRAADPVAAFLTTVDAKAREMLAATQAEIISRLTEAVSTVPTAGATVVLDGGSPTP